LDAEYNGYCWLLLAIPKINTKRQLARNMLAEGLEPATVAKISIITRTQPSASATRNSQ
jgi:hypothetical protein